MPKKPTRPRVMRGSNAPVERKPPPRESVSAGEIAWTRSLKEFCRGLPHTTQDIKWGEHLCFSVGGKMFAIFDVADHARIAFKVDDIDFERLTKKSGIIPAPYAARFGWVKVVDHAALPRREVERLLRRSREMVIERLPAKKRAEIR